MTVPRPGELFPVHAELSDFELSVLAHLGRGIEVHEVAEALSAPIDKVTSALDRVQSKTATDNLHSLVLWAAAHGICCRLS